MTNEKRFKYIMLRLAGISAILIVSFITAQIVHEVGHLSTIAWLGGKGEIKLVHIIPLLPPLPTAVRIIEMPSALLPTYLSGGIVAAIIPWLIIWLLAWRTPGKGDVWIEATSFSVMLTHLLYAPTEWGLYSQNIAVHTIGQYVAMGMAQIFFLVLYIRKIVNWLDARYDNSKRKQACLKKSR